MNRREFLRAAGAAGSFGVLGAVESRNDPSATVRIWLSHAAAAHEELPSLAAGYLRRGVAAAGIDVTVSVADRPIPLDDEAGSRLMRVVWPTLVLEGAVGRGPVRPTGDVNLLLTDGSPWSRPAGYAMRSIGTVTGARWLAGMPGPDQGSTAVPPTTAGIVGQLLLHECGHAFGLEHDHGSVVVDGSDVVSSPMVGAYAWTDDEGGVPRHDPADGGRGVTEPEGDRRRRRLGLEYSERAREALTRYRGGPLP